MKLAVDTNVLVRAVVRDDAAQAKIAIKALTDADLIAVALPCLCEFVWVLCRVNNIEKADVISAILALMACKKEKKELATAVAGLPVLEASRILQMV